MIYGISCNLLLIFFLLYVKVAWLGHHGEYARVTVGWVARNEKGLVSS